MDAGAVAEGEGQEARSNLIAGGSNSEIAASVLKNVSFSVLPRCQNV